MTIVFDASVALALLWNEAGIEDAVQRRSHAVISAVNFAEVVSKLGDRGFAEKDAREIASGLGLPVMPFDTRLAMDTGLLRPATRHAGLSLGDRACLALARSLNAPVMTADRAWADLDLGVEIRLIR